MKQESYAPQPICQELYSKDTDGVVPPIFAYRHEPTGASIVLGAFYTGTAFPAKFRGGLFFYDFIQTWLRVAHVGDDEVRVMDFATGAGRSNDYNDGIIQILQGEDGDLYTVNLSTIRRISSR